MPDYCFGDGFGLDLGGAELLQEGEGEVAALEFKGEMRGGAVVRGGGEVVEEAGQGPGFEEGG